MAGLYGFCLLFLAVVSCVRGASITCDSSENIAQCKTECFSAQYLNFSLKLNVNITGAIIIKVTLIERPVSYTGMNTYATPSNIYLRDAPLFRSAPSHNKNHHMYDANMLPKDSETTFPFMDEESKSGPHDDLAKLVYSDYSKQSAYSKGQRILGQQVFSLKANESVMVLVPDTQDTCYTSSLYVIIEAFTSTGLKINIALNVDIKISINLFASLFLQPFSNLLGLAQ